MSRYILIDFESDGLAIAACSHRDGRPVVQWADLLPLEINPFDAANSASIGVKIKELLKASDIKPAPALVCIGRERVIVKEVKFPPVKPADEPAVVHFQAVKELTEPANEMIMDYVPHGGTEETTRRATAVFLRKSVQETLLKICNAAGLTLKGVTPSPFAAAASVRRVIELGGGSQSRRFRERFRDFDHLIGRRRVHHLPRR